MTADSERADAHFQRGLDLFAEGKNEDAVAEYEQCLALNPKHSEALHGLARALQELNRLDESVAACKRLVELEPDDPLSFTALSIALHKRGLITEAESAANQARILGWKKQLREKKPRII
ncbi:MAG TPA: tetratricopeptide repeat protein [Terriglobales bacterium]|nr:tetratricopeptide repeat protein [Terriglobales bacterium]